MLFSPHRKIISLSKMQTIGTMEFESNEFLVIKNPITLNLKTGAQHPADKKPSFYFIPKGMIKKIKNVMSI